MLNHTYTSVKNANLVDCGKKQHIASQPTPLLKDNFLGEFRTKLDKQKVLSNLGIATSLSLEWEFISGDIRRSTALMKELDLRTTYTTKIGEFKNSVIDIITGIELLESLMGQEGEDGQNERIETLEKALQTLVEDVDKVNEHITNEVDVNIELLNKQLNTVTNAIKDINNLIQISTKKDNALVVLTEDMVDEGETLGLYVKDFSQDIQTSSEKIEELQTDITEIQKDLENYVTKDDLGGDDFDFVNSTEFNAYSEATNKQISDIKTELQNTVKTGSDGHVDTLYVNKISKNNKSDNIKITNSFELESGIPLDVRFVVKNIEELHSLNPSVCYAGMGVIVSDLASLYILREPEDGIIDKEFIQDVSGINWKCPEDLVIEVVTLEEYDLKLSEGSINPHMFYYIHEEVVEEPLRKDFDSDESYAEALNKWLRVLLLKYMSAVWGQEIEQLVASKASNTAVKSLESEIQRISALLTSIFGGVEGVNLNNLNKQVTTNTENLNSILGESGYIPQLLKDLEDLLKNVSNDYVTIESITKEDPNVDYIFVKQSVFDTYNSDREEALKQQITTELVITSSINMGSHTVTVEDELLLFDELSVAFLNLIPLIEVMDSATYDATENKNEDTYYMVYDEDDRYVPDSEFVSYKEQQALSIRTLSDLISSNQTSLGDLTTLATDNQNTLVLAINELVNKINALTKELDELRQQISNTEPSE